MVSVVLAHYLLRRLDGRTSRNTVALVVVTVRTPSSRMDGLLLTTFMMKVGERLTGGLMLQEARVGLGDAKHIPHVT